jgi:phytoene dehydrogenase-like protein
MTRELIIIGGGINGLVTATYLAKAGVKVLLLEARDVLGGLAAGADQIPGYRCDIGGSDAGWLLPDIAADLQLDTAGLELVSPQACVCSPQEGGRALTLWADPARTAEEINRFSPEDAHRWPEFTAQVARFAAVLEAVYAVAPPQVPDPAARDLGTLLRLGMKLRRLGKREMVEFLRVAPMSVAEWLDDWFRSDALKGALATGGITRIFQGPRGAGTAFVFLHHQVGRPAGAVRGAHYVRGGPGALAAILANVAKGYGADIRTTAPVREIVVRDGKAIGVALETGEHLAAHQVVSSTDPRRTFTRMVDAGQLDPEFLRAVRNIKCRGAVATVHLALSELPRFPGVTEEAMGGAITIAPSLDYLEHAYDDAKYGAVSRRPYLEARIPTLLDPSLAPAGKHLVTVQLQYAPYHLRPGGWDDRARSQVSDLVVETLSAYAPNVRGSVVGRHVTTPKDFEDRYGLTEGHVYHGELTLDQILFMRPVAGWARYRTPVEGLYLCGAGTHPGGGLAGAAGRNAARELLQERRA